MGDHYRMCYSVVVEYNNGSSRGFIVAANSGADVLKKLLGTPRTNKLLLAFRAIHVSEILLEEDVIE